MMFIIVSVTSLMGSLFTGGMTLSEGGGIGLGRTPWCTRIGGFVQFWFLLLPFFSVSLILRLMVLGFLLIHIALMRNSERLGFPFFRRFGQRDTSLEEFDREVEGWLPLLSGIFLRTGQMLADVVQRKGATAGILDGWVWRELKVLLVSWYDELARILIKGEDLGLA